jgi:hypothetical protein
MGFAGLARSVAAKWKTLDATIKSQHEKEAGKERERYKREMEGWKQNQETQWLRHQLHAQLAASNAMQMPSMAQFQATRSLSDSFMGRRNDISTFNFMGNQTFQMAPGQNLPSVALQQQSVWPMMPRTINSLGNMHDEGTSQQGRTADPIYAAARLPQPKGVLESAAALFQAQNVPQGTNTARFPLSANIFEQPKQGIAPVHSDLRDLTVRSTVPHRVNSIASQLSSPPQRINNLASQLDDESFDFLKSLRNGSGSSQQKGVLKTSAVRFQAQNAPQFTNTAIFPLSANPFEQPKQGIAPVHSDLRDLAAQSTVPHRVNNIASQLSSPPQRINNLVSQLDDESFDFLKSLKNGIGSSQPNGVLESSAVLFQAQNAPQVTNTARFPLSANLFDQPKQGIAPIHSDSRDLTARSTVPHRVDSIASQLSSRQRINNLVSQLDDESFDFLKSLKNGSGSSPDNT